MLKYCFRRISSKVDFPLPVLPSIIERPASGGIKTCDTSLFSSFFCFSIFLLSGERYRVEVFILLQKPLNLIVHVSEKRMCLIWIAEQKLVRLLTEARNEFQRCYGYVVLFQHFQDELLQERVTLLRSCPNWRDGLLLQGLRGFL